MTREQKIEFVARIIAEHIQSRLLRHDWGEGLSLPPVLLTKADLDLGRAVVDALDKLN